MNFSLNPKPIRGKNFSKYIDSLFCQMNFLSNPDAIQKMDTLRSCAQRKLANKTSYRKKVEKRFVNRNNVKSKWRIKWWNASRFVEEAAPYVLALISQNVTHVVICSSCFRLSRKQQNSTIASFSKSLISDFSQKNFTWFRICRAWVWVEHVWVDRYIAP